MTHIIAVRELRSLFLAPLAWTLLAVEQGLLAWIFIVLVDDFQKVQGRLISLENPPGVTDLVAVPLFRVAAWALLLLTPLLTMRLISEERRTGTLDLLLSAPVGIPTLVMGKYLGALIFLLVIVALTAFMPLTLLAGAALDCGKLAAATLGLILLAASFTAAGLYLSALMTQPVVAAAATFGLLLAFWMMDAIGASQGTASVLFKYLSLSRHYDALLLGLVRMEDVAYYLLFSAGFLGLTIHRLDSHRLRA